MRTLAYRRLDNPGTTIAFRLDHNDTIIGTWRRTDTPLDHDVAWWTAEERDAELCGTTLDAIREELTANPAAPEHEGGR